MLDDYKKNLGKIIKQKRLNLPITLHKLATVSGVSPSYIGRIEKGQRFPSASVLRKIAAPLGFDEKELFTLAGYLSAKLGTIAERKVMYTGREVDPYVARILSNEPVEVQRALIGILGIFKSISPSLLISKGNSLKKTAKNKKPG